MSTLDILPGETDVKIVTYLEALRASAYKPMTVSEYHDSIKSLPQKSINRLAKFYLVLCKDGFIRTKNLDLVSRAIGKPALLTPKEVNGNG